LFFSFAKAEKRFLSAPCGEKVGIPNDPWHLCIFFIIEKLRKTYKDESRLRNRVKV